MGTRSGLDWEAEEVLLQYVKAFRDVVNTEEGFEDFRSAFGFDSLVDGTEMAFRLVKTATDQFKKSVDPDIFSHVMVAIVLADVILERSGDLSNEVGGSPDAAL